MKAKIYSVLFLMVVTISSSVHAIPPVPPSPAGSEPAVIVCKHDLELTEEEINDLNEDVEKFVSYDAELREICFKK